MAYSPQTIKRVRSGGKSLGVKLGKLALKHKLSVQDIAGRSGATRATVYRWFYGYGVSNAYRAIVEQLIAKLQAK